MGRIKDASMQIVSGGSAGLVEICLMHPLDLVKTRFQIQSNASVSGSRHYRSLADCFTKIYTTEGFGAFYKGILPPILAEMPKRAIKYLHANNFTFTANGILSLNGQIFLKTYSLAGLGTGLTEGFFICPFEVVKVRLQAEYDVTLKQQKSAFATARQVLKSDGVTGLYRGLIATWGRHGVWNMVYFGLYHSVKLQYPPPTQSASANFAYRFAVGLAAGTLASVANIPFDVAKSRIQGPQPVNGRKYFGCVQSMALVYKEEGFFALYKGLLPKVMRLGPGGAIMMIVYEFMYDLLKSNF